MRYPIVQYRISYHDTVDLNRRDLCIASVEVQDAQSRLPIITYDFQAISKPFSLSPMKTYWKRGSKKDGIYEEWDVETGNIVHEEFNDDKRKEGNIYYIDGNGKLDTLSQYVDGKKEGIYLKFRFDKDSGQTLLIAAKQYIDGKARQNFIHEYWKEVKQLLKQQQQQEQQKQESRSQSQAQAPAQPKQPTLPPFTLPTIKN